MIVRCGSCRTQFEVSGPGRYPCPVCGAVNVVRGPGAAPGQGPAGGFPGGPGQVGGAGEPPARPEPPSPRITCAECSFSFIVGQIAIAACPNCGAEVETGVDASGGESESTAP